MKTISTIQLHRGHRLARIWPSKSKNGRGNDPLYRFHRLADKRAKPLADREIDRLIYGG